MSGRSGRLIVGFTLGLAAFALAGEPLKLKPAGSVYVAGDGTPLRDPEGVACRGRGGVWIADTGGGRLLEFEAGPGGLVAKRTLVLPQLPVPLRVQLDGSGRLYVLDGKQRRIARLDAAGAFESWVDLPAAPGGLDALPRALAIDAKNRLAVLDVGGARVLRFGTDGKFESELPLPAEARFCSALAFGGKGELFLLDSVGRRLFVVHAGANTATPLGEPLSADLDFPVALAADGQGNLFVADQNGGGIVIVGEDGSFRGRQVSIGWREGQLRYPSDLCLDPQGNLFVADRGNQRAQGFTVAR